LTSLYLHDSKIPALMGNWTTLTQSFDSLGVGARPIVEWTLHGGYKITWTGEIAGGPAGSEIETPIEIIQCTGRN
jgi:hypothetical protein